MRKTPVAGTRPTTTFSLPFEGPQSRAVAPVRPQPRVDQVADGSR